MATLTISRGAANFLTQFFGVSGVSNLKSHQALTLLEDAEIDNTGEAAELWKAFCQHHNLDPKMSSEKFQNTKFYREHQ